MAQVAQESARPSIVPYSFEGGVPSYKMASSTQLRVCSDDDQRCGMGLVGFGTYKCAEGKQCMGSVTAALNAGYRHIDTAAFYCNEQSVGQAIRAFCATSGVKREEIFVTSKLWIDSFAFKDATAAFMESYKKLDLEYIDLFLLHWPVSKLRIEAWKALVEMKAKGLVRQIGVSNYYPRHLKELYEHCNEWPAVNQIELHPHCQRKEVTDFCQQHGIIVQAYSPFAKGAPSLLKDPTLTKIAKELNVTTAHVMLRWSLQRGFVPLPKSSNPFRIAENFNVWGFELSADHMKQIEAVDKNEPCTWDPSTEP